MKKLTVIINGKGGVGKDTLCDFAAKHFSVANISSIDVVKDIATKCGWHGKKDEKSRKFLSDLKNLLVDYNDLPTICLLNQYDLFRYSNKKEILFVHIREASEIEKFIKEVKQIDHSDCITLLITRDTDVESWGNSSDDDVENYAYDYIYENNSSLEEAEGDFIHFLKTIMEE